LKLAENAASDSKWLNKTADKAIMRQRRTTFGFELKSVTALGSEMHTGIEALPLNVETGHPELHQQKIKLNLRKNTNRPCLKKR
jgi:hypothetical protein